MSSVNNDKRESFIDDRGIKALCLDIQGYTENIKKSLDRFNDLVDGSHLFYEDDTRVTFVNKRDNLKIYLNTLVDNLNSYIDDYNLVLSRFKLNDNSFTLHFGFNNIDK